MLRHHFTQEERARGGLRRRSHKGLGGKSKAERAEMSAKGVQALREQRGSEYFVELAAKGRAAKAAKRAIARAEERDAERSAKKRAKRKG
jgi:hypothetical protein